MDGEHVLRHLLVVHGLGQVDVDFPGVERVVDVSESGLLVGLLCPAVDQSEEDSVVSGNVGLRLVRRDGLFQLVVALGESDFAWTVDKSRQFVVALRHLQVDLDTGRFGRPAAVPGSRLKQEVVSGWLVNTLLKKSSQRRLADLQVASTLNLGHNLA